MIITQSSEKTNPYYATSIICVTGVYSMQSLLFLKEKYISISLYRSHVTWAYKYDCMFLKAWMSPNYHCNADRQQLFT